MATQGNPIATFREDWSKAKAEKDPNAPFCTLVTIATSTAGGVAPATRIVGLRQVTDEGGFLLFVNSSSPKWSQLQANSNFELLVFWPTQMIQYRISGRTFDTLSEEEMKELWEKKPHTSKLLDYFYTNHQPQSSELPSRDIFLDGMKQLKGKFKPDGQTAVPYQEIARGLILKPISIEEWRGSTSDRLHLRFRHDRKEDGSWETTPLVP